MTKVKWLDELPRSKSGITWGVPWKKGELGKKQKLALKNSKGEECYVQSWPLAYWPDGSVKWTAQSAVFDSDSDRAYEIIKTDRKLKPGKAIEIYESKEQIIIDNDVMKCYINKSGQDIIEKVLMKNKVVNEGGKLVVINEVRKDNIHQFEKYYSKIENVSIENKGPLRVVIKVEGVHSDEKREWIPFIFRMNFSLGIEYFRVTHTFFFDGDPNKDFIKGIGIQFSLSLNENDFNRHVRYALEEGMYLEPAKLLLTRFCAVDNKAYEKQINGEFVDIEKADTRTIELAEKNAIWNNFKLTQDSANHYKIIKKSEENLTYVDVLHGSRANGLMYVGSESAGISLGLKNFWQRYPSSLEVKGLAKEKTTAILWLWDPAVEAMDLRHYSNSPHMVAYEGFEEIRSTPLGIANTSDVYIGFYNKMQNNEEIYEMSKEWQNNSLLVCDPEHYYKTKTTGKWGLPDKSDDKKKFFEDILEENFEFYRKEIEQRNWYGYWNYGDVMHTYDGVRHQWRYDLGGYAWQNTELMPNIWLWYQFLRTGNALVYKIAEAMTRHTSEVDAYHFGEYKGLGSRHNVVHWGCSCKEARISMAILHKFYYYLTGDERVGEILTEIKDGDQAVERLEPLRGFFPESDIKTHIRTGPDWSAFCSDWETEWERTENEEYKNKIIKGMDIIKSLPNKLLSTPACGYDSKTSILKHIEDERMTGEFHMMISFGAPQIWIEIGELLEDEEWKDMIAEFGAFYMLSDEEKKKRTNGKLSNKCFSWPMFATGMAAYCAKRNRDRKLGKKAWNLLFKELNAKSKNMITPSVIKSWRSIYEDPNVTTNCVSQWSINTIMCLELIGDMIPEEFTSK
ncbi:hypothetical protein [Clostridium sp. HBUAS56017]|uniref:exo-rhamnogalacturonan lyase family protein n=1 Tax=Clostridium sp. HBUAS56017 TaxID=2571128 RepID=UPI001177AC98|nr:hypothetical protein [Clostridium sp. HBUAS56017]